MKVIVEYIPHDCVIYRSWCVIKNEEEDKFSRDITSPYDDGVESLIASTFYPSDNAVITLFPAKSSQRKNDRNDDYYKGKYLLILSNVTETETYSSYQRYSWEEASKIMYLLKDLSFQAALLVWKSKKY